MGTQLRIYWDGNAPGLKEGRLSLATFGPALDALLRAARNIARRQVAAARGEAYDPATATRSTIVDLQLSKFEAGSADQTFDVVPLPTNFGALQLIDDLSDRITRELYVCINDEARGIRRDRFVRQFLHSLPKGLSRQRYSVLVDGKPEAVAEFTELVVAADVEEYPAMVKLRGKVEAVQFGERGEPRVSFAPWEGRMVTASATKEQVRQAIELQGKAQALFLLGDRPRLLWIRADDAPVSPLAEEEREEYLFKRWGGVLEGLSGK